MTQLQQYIIEIERINLAHPIKNNVILTNSAYQEIAIVDTVHFGRALFLDGVAQSSALDEFIYHEALVHPTLVAHPNPQRIFIAGGGEGALLREILKHNTVKQVVMVDLDETMVSLAKQHLTDWHQGAFDDERVTLVHTDAQQYLAQTSELYDVIIADLPDPFEDSPITPLYETPFFELVQTRLTSHGVFASHIGILDLGEQETALAIISALQQAFQQVIPYQTTIPFFRSMWGFCIAGNHLTLSQFSNIDPILQERDCDDLRFYDAETHQHMVALPKYLRQ